MDIHRFHPTKESINAGGFNEPSDLAVHSFTLHVSSYMLTVLPSLPVSFHLFLSWFITLWIFPIHINKITISNQYSVLSSLLIFQTTLLFFLCLWFLAWVTDGSKKTCHFQNPLGICFSRTESHLFLLCEHSYKCHMNFVQTRI